jgi:hypothetical protein
MFGLSAPEKALRALKELDLFSSDFPKRKSYTHAEWSRLTEGEELRSHDPAIAAIKRVNGGRGLVEMVRSLSDAKYVPAVPLLAKIWTNCPVQPVRTAAGHALRAIGTAEARAALRSAIEDADHLSVFLAVAAVFDDDPMKAYDYFLPYFEPQKVRLPGGAVIPTAALSRPGNAALSSSVGRDCS